MRLSSLFIFTSLFTFCFSLFTSPASAGDTTVVRTIRYDTNLRAGLFQFPNDPNKNYEKILMLYSMRCKNGLISTQAEPNKGCGEWDYNCYTYVVDSSQTDSLMRKTNKYKISGFSGNTYPYTLQPVHSYYEYVQASVTYTDTLSESFNTIGNGNTNLSHPFGGGHDSRSQYLFTATELSAGGMTAGDINGLRFFINNAGSNIDNLTIRIKQVNLDSLIPDIPELDGFTRVYYQNTQIPTTGQLSLNFSTSFYWDGVSNLLIDISYHHITGIPLGEAKGHDAGFISTLHTAQPMSFLRFKGGIQSMKMNPAWYDSISQEISLGFWCYGDSMLLPTNSSIIEGRNNSNIRQVNIHLPWSNSNVYWDCGGNSSGYDRIFKAASPAEIKGKWNYWTFTKNATSGHMKIYLNGNLWLHDSNKTRSINITKMIVGSDFDGNNRWPGYLSELSIWNTELDSYAIRSNMMHTITSAHPDWNHLMVYYPLAESPETIAIDNGPHHFDATLVNPVYGNIHGYQLFRNFTATSQRPNISLVRGQYTSVFNQDTLVDSVVNIPNSVISYVTQNNNLITVDTTYSWPATQTYIYNGNGQAIDSIPVQAEDTLHQSVLTYYQRRPMRIELINFITPYGKGLNLNGLNGKTWTFDVTDFATILKGPRYLAMGDGIYQEDNDITFVYYEGTPPRSVKNLQQIWPSGSWVTPSYSDIYNNNYFEPRQVTLAPEAAQYKVRSAISGHGQEGEFIPRMHTIRVNDTLAFTRQVWTECAENPIYPQGGTWIYDRAGWCPGAAVDQVEYNLPTSLTPGNNITIDYSLPNISNPGASNYRINNQLVTYGPPNFSLDARIEYIKQPSDRTEFQRFNPLCSRPVVAIRNTGSSTLTSAEIIYGRQGGTMSTYNWTGDLPFLGVAQITLPLPDWQSSLTNRFLAKISNPNGMADQYADNDTMSSAFHLPPVYASDLVFELLTNSAGYQNSYTITDSEGNIIFTKGNLSNNVVYLDTLHLQDGCYTLSLKDNGDNGLNFWNEPAQGNGYFRINTLDTTIIKSFISDFGDNIYHQFTIGLVLPVEESTLASIHVFNVFPNPANTNFTAEFSLPLNTRAKLSVMNVMGQSMLCKNIQVSEKLEKILLDVSKLENGFYFVVLESGNTRQSKKLIVRH